MAVARRLSAFVFLGYRAVVVHPWNMLFKRHDKGPAAFLRNYTPDGLVPLSPSDREQLNSFMKCIDCGLCDAVCPLVGQLDRRDFSGPSALAVAYTRATPDLGVIATTIRHLPADCGTCNKCVRICPTRVPLKNLFDYANRKLVEVEAARRGVLPILQAPAALPAKG